MPRVIITTCGTSLLTSNCWKDISKDPSILSPDLRNYPQQRVELEIRYAAYTQPYFKSGDITGLAGQFDIDVWNNTDFILKLPAELASLKAIIEFFARRNAPLNNQDSIVLLHSDNAEGRFCAQVIKEVLSTEIKISAPVTLHKVTGLDPSNVNQFNQALDSVWQDYINKQINAQNHNEYIFNLTGGYKATAMVLSALAYKMHCSAPVTIFYLHETTDYRNIAIFGWRKAQLGAGYMDIPTGQFHSTFGPPLF